MSDTGTIFNIMKYAVHDGPGIRTTVFFKGCPLTCLWCHNPESQAGRPEVMVWDNKCIGCGDCRQVCNHELCMTCGACAAVCPSGAREAVGSVMTVADVMREIEKDMIFYDESGGGVTFSGGEPLQQPDFLQKLLTLCRQKRIHTAVDTTGFAPAAALLGISGYTDLFLYDLKLMDDVRHKEYTGVSNRLILENLQELSRVHRDIRIRYPFIPGINDDEKNIRHTGRFLAGLQGVSPIHLLPYQHLGAGKYHRIKKEYRLRHLVPPGADALAPAKKILEEYGLTVMIGG
jgi:pyruvate formate lyase activating enzyme